ncbi:MAG: hypothetical protein ACJ8D5_08415 [Sphingomicrobium sp.]
MLHLLPESGPRDTPRPSADLLARLASVRHALRLVDPCGGGPAPDPEGDEAVATAWEEADELNRRRFDARSGRLVAATAAGLEALLAERETGAEPNTEAAEALVEQIRRELEAVSRAILT